MRTKTKPFQVTRMPALNGEWIDMHVSESGKVCMSTSGYIEVDSTELIAAIKKLVESSGR